MKKRILSCLLAAVLLAGALPLGAAAATDQATETGGLFPYSIFPMIETAYLSRSSVNLTSGHTVKASEDVTASVGETVTVTVSVSAAYNAYDLKLTYDTGRLTLNSVKAADSNAVIYKNSGNIRVLGYGPDKEASTAVLTMSFTTKAAGTAEVKISSAKVDSSGYAITRNTPEALIADNNTIITIESTYRVTLDSGLTADSLSATAGEDYIFYATDYNNYDYAPTATVGGVTVEVEDLGNGKYAIPGDKINGEIVIAANMTGKTHKVTIKGSDVTGEKTATYGEDYTFKLNREYGYQYTITVTIGGTKYTGYTEEDEGFVIPGTAITGDIVITVVKTVDDSGKLNVKFIGSGAKDAKGKTKTDYGVEYSFKVNKKKGYTYTVSVRVNGVRVGYDYDYELDTYYVLADKVKGDITIVVTKVPTVEISEYITLDGQSMYLVIYNGHINFNGEVKDEIPLYNGRSMYWSEKYNAYAWLVTSSDSEKKVKQAVEEKITTAAGNTAAEVNYSGNVDLSSRIDLSDAQLAYDMYNAQYTLADMEMIKFLNADVNADRRVDVRDAAWIVNFVLHES